MSESEEFRPVDSHLGAGPGDQGDPREAQLRRALGIAQRIADQTMAATNEQAARIIEDARDQAAVILKQADEHAQVILRDAEIQAKTIEQHDSDAALDPHPAQPAPSPISATEPTSPALDDLVALVHSLHERLLQLPSHSVGPGRAGGEIVEQLAALERTLVDELDMAARRVDTARTRVALEIDRMRARLQVPAPETFSQAGAVVDAREHREPSPQPGALDLDAMPAGPADDQYFDELRDALDARDVAGDPLRFGTPPQAASSVDGRTAFSSRRIFGSRSRQ